MHDHTILEWLKQTLSPEADLSYLEESEERIRRAYRQYLRGYETDVESLRKIVMDDYEGNGEVSQVKIPFYSLCAHHFLPFFGTIDIHYIPNTKLIGIGKLPRIVELFARRFTLQEKLVVDIGQFIVETLEPKSVKVASEARHLCVEARGPQAIGSTTKAEFSWLA